jgi:CBS domain containing-hemolysin-like protein
MNESMILLPVLLIVLTLAAYVDRLYAESGKFLAREFQENIDAWEKLVEPKLHLSRESAELSAAVLRQFALAAVAVLFGMKLYPVIAACGARGMESVGAVAGVVARTVFELILIVLIFDRLLPFVFFMRTRGLWIARIRILIAALFYLVTPATLLLGLLLSIVSLAEPTDAEEEEHPEEKKDAAMDALLEAGEEEGILEESDRALVRSVVEFGDKVTREVMTPRPKLFAVAGTMTIAEFTAELVAHPFSRVPVYSDSPDHVTGIAFAHDLLQIADVDAAKRTVAEIQRPAAFVPESKKVNELLEQMQRQQQHMCIVIDEYGGVAGVVTIEDLLEEIVGNIADEHDDEESAPVREEDGAFVVAGGFEVSRLKELFAEEDESDDAAAVVRIPPEYEATTIGGLVTEIAGHIPLQGEVVEAEGLRFEVLASTTRRVERVRVKQTPRGESEPE